MNYSPILLGASDGAALCWSPKPPWVGPSHFPFHILSLYFSSTASHHTWVPTSLPLLPHPALPGPGQPSTSSARMSYPDLLSGSTCPPQLLFPSWLAPGIMKHPAYKVTVAPTVRDPPRISGRSEASVSHSLYLWAVRSASQL